MSTTSWYINRLNQGEGSKPKRRAKPLQSALLPQSYLFGWNGAIYRTLLFLPSVVPVVAASALWIWLLDPRDGLVNYTLSLFGVTGNDWFKSPREFLFSGHAGSKDGLVLMSLWGVGNFMVIFFFTQRTFLRGIAIQFAFN